MTDWAEKVTPEVTKTKKEKPVAPKKTGTIIKLPLNGEMIELTSDERLPVGFLEKKLKDDQLYISVSLYREIMRQMDCFGVPQFTDPEKFMSGKDKWGIDKITYRVKCTVERFKDWRKDPIILTGVWYSSFSGGILLSDAIHWNIATLDAKALRSALKHGPRIFEYPEVEVIDEWVPGDVIAKANEIIKPTAPAPATTAPAAAPVATAPATTKVDTKTKAPVAVKPAAADAIDWVVADMPTEAKPVGPSVETQITEDYKELYAKLITTLAELDPNAKVTKPQILDLATQLKLKYGDQYKKYILGIITSDLNKAQ